MRALSFCARISRVSFRVQLDSKPENLSDVSGDLVFPLHCEFLNRSVATDEVYSARLLCTGLPVANMDTLTSFHPRHNGQLILVCLISCLVVLCSGSGS